MIKWAYCIYSSQLSYESSLSIYYGNGYWIRTCTVVVVMPIQIFKTPKAIWILMKCLKNSLTYIHNMRKILTLYTSDWSSVNFPLTCIQVMDQSDLSTEVKEKVNKHVKQLRGLEVLKDGFHKQEFIQLWNRLETTYTWRPRTIYEWEMTRGPSFV